MIEAKALTVPHRFPQRHRVVLGQRHDRLSGPVAQEIGLLDAVDEGVVQGLTLLVQPDQLVRREGGVVQDQPPGKRSRRVGGGGAFGALVRRRRLVGSGAGEEVVQQTDGMMPFQGHGLEGEPGDGGRDGRLDQVFGEEGVEAREEEWEIG